MTPPDAPTPESELTPDPWAEADAAYYDRRADLHMALQSMGEDDAVEAESRRATVARYRRAAQRARGVPVTEDGR